MIENRYLKPKEAVCSVCGDKIKVGEKYALGTVRGYKKDPDTNQLVCFGRFEEIFCGFCKPTSDEYDTRPERIREAIKVQDELRRDKQGYRTEHVCCWLEKHLDFYRNKKGGQGVMRKSEEEVRQACVDMVDELIDDHKKNISQLEIMKEHVNDMSSEQFERFAHAFGYSMAPDMIKVTKLYKCLAILLECDETDLDIFVESRRQSLEITVKKKEDVVMENKKRIQAGAFVIPNSSWLVGDFIISSVARRVKAQMEEICAQFDMDFDPSNDRLIQMWFHSNELGSDNLEAHGFDYGENSYEFRYGYLPYKILKDIKEGDTLTIEFNCDKYEKDDDDHWKTKKVPITMDVKFEQLPYRYRNKGRFEEAVKYVL